MTPTTILADHWHDGYGPWWAIPWFLFFLLVPLTVWLVAWRARWFRRSPVHDARAALAARYARGEIDGAEYRERLDVLEGSDR